MGADLLTQHGGILGGLVLVIILLVREVVRERNGQSARSMVKNMQELLLARMKQVDEIEKNPCPVIDVGGTTLTKEAHDELCAKKLEVVDEKMHNVGQTLDYLKMGQVEVKGDVKRILNKLEGG